LKILCSIISQKIYPENWQEEIPLVTVTISPLFQLYSRQFAMDEKNERFINQLLWISATMETLCIPCREYCTERLKTFSFIFSSERKFVESCSSYDSNESIRYKVQYTKRCDGWLESFTGKSSESILSFKSRKLICLICLIFDQNFFHPFSEVNVGTAQLNLNKIWYSSDKHGNGIKV
jgi:hypothetical protein